MMRSLVVRLGQAAGRGLADPRDALAPAVEPLVQMRAELRATGHYRLADTLRDALAAAGVELRDTAARHPRLVVAGPGGSAARERGDRTGGVRVPLSPPAGARLGSPGLITIPLRSDKPFLSARGRVS
ncbi:hypothetical protein E1281_07725 [Actinomadura sp. KC345]|uniref:hypothetical protein n=1 Tax=Actinomadura sp. KC345 TaxID=2530371 RepID=UPI00104820BA|nr:hypothetical protein [Actinomadura sp. KC345]TDC56373.1 hypothetical protein E1281_07725 [Actinomadura sp. KC345]